MHDVFLSYSRKNHKTVQRIASDLEDQGISVWLDSIELTVGDQFHQSIERGIAECRFFCIALSDESMASYYVRQIEFEQAFARMVSEQRESFILPIVIRKLNEPLPIRLQMLNYIDFSKRNRYTNNMHQLTSKILGLPRDFTGSRWYKGLNISNLGTPVGIGPTSQKATIGQSYQLMWKKGEVTRVNVYTDGVMSNYKILTYDGSGRVVQNRMYSPDGLGGWSVQEDVWYYEYDPETGRRIRKTMGFDGEQTRRVVTYGAAGNAITESIVTPAGQKPDRQFPYARKVFLYDADGNATGEECFDDQNRPIPAE